MKQPFWKNPNKKIEILDPSEEAQKEYGLLWGWDTIALSDKHIQALRDGKMLAWNDGEYSTFVLLDSAQKEQ